MSQANQNLSKLQIKQRILSNLNKKDSFPLDSNQEEEERKSVDEQFIVDQNDIPHLELNDNSSFEGNHDMGQVVYVATEEPAHDDWESDRALINGLEEQQSNILTKLPPKSKQKSEPQTSVQKRRA